MSFARKALKSVSFVLNKFSQIANIELLYNGMLVAVRTSINLRRCREKTYNVST